MSRSLKPRILSTCFHGGAIGLKLTASQGGYLLLIIISLFFVEYALSTRLRKGGESYITKVFDYMPAVGQFTNTLPLYEEGGYAGDNESESIGRHRQ